MEIIIPGFLLKYYSKDQPESILGPGIHANVKFCPTRTQIQQTVVYTLVQHTHANINVYTGERIEEMHDNRCYRRIPAYTRFHE